MHYVLLVLPIASIVLLLFSMIYVPILHWRVGEQKVSIKAAVRTEFSTYFIAFIMLFFASALSKIPSDLSFLAWIQSVLLIVIVTLVFAGMLTWVSYQRLIRWLNIKSAKVVEHG
jgi:hypothetical protein